jgi:hypothetical protein
MSSRFSLRFISGNHEGERHELEGPRVTLGRKPGNILQVNDSSVSGTHAELLIQEESVTLRDRNSTNGTKVAGSPIEERALAHGDEIIFGSVRAVFEDAQLGGLSEEEESDAVGSLSAAALKDSGKRSRSGLLIALAVILLLGGGAWYGLGMVEGEGGGSALPVVYVEGDLFDGSGSFEGDSSGWGNEEAASVEFLGSALAASTGSNGMQAVLVTGERASLESPSVSTRAGMKMIARASASADLEVGARVGLRFSRGADSLSTVAWSAVIDGDEEVTVEAVTPAGHDSAQVVVEARASGDGSVSVDDASLISAGTSQAAQEIGGYGFHLLGDPSQALCVTKISSVFVSGLEVKGAVLTGTLTEKGMDLSASQAGTLSFAVDAALVARGVASIGESGHQVHGREFEREGVTSLLLGKGNDLVAVHWETPCDVRARAEGEGMGLEAPLADSAFWVQVDFKEERIHAGDLAYAARGAERDGQLGDCLTSWAELLERYPYQEALVVEAEGVRGRLVQAGLLELQEVRAEIERASFFRLVELYRSCRAQASSVGEHYRGSEVEAEANVLLEAVDAELVLLEVDLDADEVSRLRAIHAVLRASESPKLAGEVASYLETEFNETTEGGGQ